MRMSAEGKKKIEWAAIQMPVLKILGDEFETTRPFNGVTIGCCLHVTSETANLVIALKKGGAKVVLCASNPLSTSDSVAASLTSDYGVSVFAKHGEDKKTYYEHLDKVIAYKPQITMDDGADLVNMLHKRKITWEFYGSSEETTTGVIRLKAMAKEKVLKVAVIAVNDSDTKHLFDNRYGTGQSTIDGILRATNILLSGKRVVVCGYGWCGRGIASRMRGMGAIVTICEVNPIRALEAVMDGYGIDKIGRAVYYGEIFVTATGNKNVINISNIRKMKDGAIVANSGHFNVEFDYEGLIKIAKSKRLLRDNLEEITIDNKRIFVLGEGRLVNLVAAEGHPAGVMDMSFANQALAALYLVKHAGKLKRGVYTLPKAIDERVARLKLKAMGFKFDKLTAEQHKYLTSWQEGT